MVGDRDVLVAQAAGRFDHFCERGFSVARVGVHLQIAADVVERDQRREFVRFRERDFAAILAQLGRDPVEAECGIHVALGAARNALRPSEYAVLVQLQLFGLRDLAQLDVVRLGAREVLHRGAEAGRLDHAQVHLQSARQPHGRARVALRGDMRDFAVLAEALDHGRRFR